MRRFFSDIVAYGVNTIKLPKEESIHIARVLRMKLGDKIELIDGKGNLFVAEIVLIGSKTVEVKIISSTQTTKDKYHIHIAIAPTKLNDRFEWFLEKSTELGIHEISPLLCDNSERKKINWERYNRILIAAMKQSKRLYLPQLNQLIKFDTFIEKNPNGLLAHCYEDESRNTTIYKELQKDITRWTSKNTPILIGPEGDFSLKEVKKAIENQYQTVTLGETRLRTETAGIYSCMNIKLFFEEKR